MKIVGIIPSRYHSTRLPGKALAEIEGMPMLLHVCKAALSCSALDAVYVATDNEYIREVCEDYGCPVLMTSDTHHTPTDRTHEAACLVDASRYVMIGGDEPLITPADIRHTVEAALHSSACVINAMTAMITTEEIEDPSNIKLACNQDNECTAISRTPFFPPDEASAGTGLPLQMKFVSIGVYTKASLDFFASTSAGVLEKRECCDLLRFMEHGKTVELTNIGTHTLSVDTPEDLTRVRRILKGAAMTISSPNYKAIIFDLDGTLLDTAEGVLTSVRHTIDTMGYEPLPDEVLRTFIGPPVKRSLSVAYHLSEEEADQATAVFREQYKNHDLLKAVPYEGIEMLLKKLKESGFLLGVATLKREDYALTILEHFRLAPYFDSICGSDFANKMQKSDVLKKCTQELAITEKEAILIGDTSSDSTGAKEAGVDFIAVTYGFGPATAAEWKYAHPIHTADNTDELRDFFIKER